MKFGVQIAQVGMSWPEFLDVWTELDRNSRFDSVWDMDHFVSGMGQEAGSDDSCLEGWTALAALAQATSRIRVGCLVTGNTYRHPAVLAKMATTVDHISNGRLEFGLGAAWHEYEHAAFKIPFYTVKERLDRLDEAAHLIKLLWTEDRPKFDGKFYQLDAPPYNPPNVQKPHPPFMIGGGGEKRTLKIVAKYADKANVQDTPDGVRRKFEILDQHCSDVGRDPSEVTRTLHMPLFLTENPEFQERVVQGVQAIREVSAEDARKMVFMGSPAEVTEQIRTFAALGVEEIVFSQFPRPHMKSLMRFSEEVIPAFR